MISIDELEKYLWGAAVDLRGQIDASAYKDYIFPLVFFKRICDVHDEEYAKYVAEGGVDYADSMMQESSIKIPAGCHWNNVFNTTENIGQKLVDVFKKIEHANPAHKIDGRPVGGLEGIFGDKSIWTNKAKMPDIIIRSLLNSFNKQKLTLENCPADEMGTGYEYLIGQFADDAGHTAQEFYTNRTVVELMAEILQLQPHESIYDPTCGSGGMLIKSLTYLKDKGEEWRDVKVFGQELNAGTSAIARMNCYLHGIHDFSIVNADTIEDPAFVKDGKVGQFNVVLANPPYSIKTWNREKFAHDKWGRCFLGTPPQNYADYAFIQHIIASMDSETGRCAILLPHGVLFRRDEEELRKKLVELDVVECVIALGHYLFFNSAMISAVMICKAKKPVDRKGKVLFIEAENEVTRKNAQSFLEPKHIQRMVDAYRRFVDQPGYCQVATNDEILKNNGKLSISLYVDSVIEADETTPEDACAEWSDNSVSLKNSLAILSSLV